MKNILTIVFALVNTFAFSQTQKNALPQSTQTDLQKTQTEVRPREAVSKSVAAASGEYIMMNNTSSFTILPSGMKGNKTPSSNHSGSNTIYGENVMTNTQFSAIYNVGVGNNSLRYLTTGSYNVAIGYEALRANTNGGLNIGVGNSALANNVGASRNIAIGGSSLFALSYNNSGAYYPLDNIAIGFESLYDNNPTLSPNSISQADQNIGIGNYSLRKNTTGRNNTAIGIHSAYTNTTGQQNISLGNYALQSNISGNFNIAVGFESLYSNTASYNVAVGDGTLHSNNFGQNNVGIGFQSLYNNTNSFGAGTEYAHLSSNNTSLGYFALRENTRGFNNTAIGAGALRNNVGNYIPNQEFPTEYGMENTAVGYNALYTNTQGFNNTAVGSNALYALNSTGGLAYSNTALGIYAGNKISTGNGNTVIGASAGTIVQSGSNNTFVGYAANAPSGSTAITNATAIGYFAIVNASNKVRIGNTSVTVVEGPVAYTFPSDRRLKENIKSTNIGLEFIKRLQTVSYNYIADNTKTRHDGFIAQDIEAAMKDLNVSFSGVKKSDDGMYSLAYSDFVMPLVNAVKEQQSIIENQASKILKLEEKLQKMSDLEARLSLIESSLNSKKINQETKTDK
jgi:trimeric autotransporter adhesin